MIVRSWERSEKQAGKVFLLPFSKPNTDLSGHPLGILVWLCLKRKKGREPEKRYGLFVNSLALKPDKLRTEGAYPIIQWPWLTASHPWTLTPSCIKRGSSSDGLGFLWGMKAGEGLHATSTHEKCWLVTLAWFQVPLSLFHCPPHSLLTRLYLRARHVSGQAQESL